MILVPIYMLFIREDDGGGSAGDSALVDAARDPAQADNVLADQIADVPAGIELRYPEGWSGKLVKGTALLTSASGTTVISVAAKATAPQAKSLFAASIKGVSGDLTDPQVTYVKDPPPIAGLPSAQAAIKGAQGGVPRSVFVSVARGKKAAYLISVAAPQDGGEVGEANLILLRGLKLTG